MELRATKRKMLSILWWRTALALNVNTVVVGTIHGVSFSPFYFFNGQNS